MDQYEEYVHKMSEVYNSFPQRQKELLRLGTEVERMVEVREGCMALVFRHDSATNAALAGTYKAWLTDSDATTAPATRFASADFTGWYLGTDGTPIAHGWADLTTLEDNDVDYLKAPIRFDQNGSDINVETTAWTNTGPDGEQDPMNKHCANWTSGLFALSGSFGLSSATTLNADWTLAGTLPCTSDVRLYCFQTAP